MPDIVSAGKSSVYRIKVILRVNRSQRIGLTEIESLADTGKTTPVST